MLDQKVLPEMIDLHFDLASLHLWTALLFLTLNYSKKWQGNFLALGFFTVTYWLGDIELLSVTPSGVETINLKELTCSFFDRCISGTFL